MYDFIVVIAHFVYSDARSHTLPDFTKTARMRRDEQLGRKRAKHHRSRTEGAIVWLQPSSVSLFSRPSSLSVSAPSGTTGGEYSSTTTTAKNLDVERTKERLNNLGWG